MQLLRCTSMILRSDDYPFAAKTQGLALILSQIKADAGILWLL